MYARLLKTIIVTTLACGSWCTNANAQGCLEDVIMCSNGKIYFRDPKKNCEFPACPASDQAQDKKCRTDFFLCDSGDIVRRDPKNDCMFFECPEISSSSSSDTSSTNTTAFGNSSLGSSSGSGSSEAEIQFECTNDVFVCAGGSFVRRNSSLLCNFNPCPTFSKCTSDIKVCKGGSVVRRNINNECKFDPCPFIFHPKIN